ncbi:alpha/beta hydrolase domain-containing protein [Streptomyces sp. N50]|uniref:alpha/beta hydrolase domain-containing protein n=1 Tax=Streptomyces sp. N50 TaxID=3081765 RepID=UPI0029624F61|nr:alpha/beta hydrolase domain-containing protein [Streptomyces sp. N50]WOX09952.1 alpha/beta hydrolase domain-containing protein [Streptomyces sp. N50]
MNTRRAVLAVVASTCLFLGLSGITESTSAAANAVGPEVTGPVTGGKGAVVLQGTSFDLGGVGYTQSEFFLSGTATSYTSANPLGSDGRWDVTPASTAPYTTRIVMNRPSNPTRFNGTVVVEWLNVSAGLDTAPEWIYTHNELIREGYAWIGVSAQAVGVAATKAADPVRYAALSHPGDSYSYDIFTQAGQAVRDSAAKILGGLRPRTVLAEGESQSAFRLTTYVDAVQPLAHAYDGFLVHSRAGFAAALSQAPQADVPTPAVVEFRTDTDVPVLTVQTETDLMLLGYLTARQPDTGRLRFWEVAGTAHADDYVANVGAADTGNGAVSAGELDAMLDPPTGTPAFSCADPINTGPAHYVMDGAQHALRGWVLTGIPPAKTAQLQVTTSSDGTPAFVLDANGNATGGIRTPAVDAPVAALSGLGQTGSAQFCFLFGTTTPFTAAKLAALYPTHAEFVRQWAARTAAAVAAGTIRPADAADLVEAAVRSGIGG